MHLSWYVIRSLHDFQKYIYSLKNNMIHNSEYDIITTSEKITLVVPHSDYYAPNRYNLSRLRDFPVKDSKSGRIIVVFINKDVGRSRRLGRAYFKIYR